MKTKTPKIGVVGGVTMDLFYKIDELPQKGHAVESNEYFLSPGGKALNIATAIKHFQGEPLLITSIGKDKLSEEIFETLVQEDISQEGFVVQENIPTDLISVLVTPDGKSTFIGTRGANFYLTSGDIERFESKIKNLNAIIVTLEIPTDTAKMVLEIAKKYNIITMLNPAPSDDFSLDLLPLVDYFFLNEHEALLCSVGKKSIEEQVKFFLHHGARKVVITHEAKGYIIGDKQNIISKEAFKVQAIDSTGAGDTFGGIFITAMFQGSSEDVALQFASAGGALVAQRHGSGLVIPTREDIEEFLQNYGNH